jgi:two-component system, OmpR family, heavy metal sensor histidine kinase CusS
VRSIRASLITGSVAGTIVVFTLSGAAIYRGARSGLVHQLDEALVDQVRVIASVVKYTPDGMEVEVGDLDLPTFTSVDGSGYVEILGDDNGVLYRSPRLGDHHLDMDSGARLDHPVTRWIRTADGARARAVDLRTHAVVDPEDWEDARRPPPPPPVIHLVAADSAPDVHAFLARLRALLIGVGAAGAFVVAAVLAAVIERSLRPLNRLAGQISDLSDADLSARISLPTVPNEIDPVVDQLNQLLARLEDAFEREHTFSSDIAHELRTPLAGLRSTLEVALSRPREPGDYRDTMYRLLEIVRGVQNMVETLLYLGRLDSGQVEIERHTVDLCAMVKTAWEPLADIARAKQVSTELHLPDGINVIADPVLFGVAIRNVLDNAVSYVNEGGHIRINAGTTNGVARLKVENSGSLVPQERVGELLRRFTRIDASRRGTGEHFGLGLALTSRIADALGCDTEITSAAGGDFVIVLSAPLT